MLRVETQSSGARFTVGRDNSGRWIVTDRDGLVGGLFIDRASAMHFAMSESNYLAGAVCCSSATVNLSLGPAFEELIRAAQAVEKA